MQGIHSSSQQTRDIHGHTRKRELVDMLVHLGLSISYDRVLDITTRMATSAND